MAEIKEIFKGFRIVTDSAYSATTNKNGFIWFVKRSNETDGYGDIYFGEKHYGHNGNEAELIANLSGAVQTIIGSGFSQSSVTEVVNDVIVTLGNKANSSDLDNYVLITSLEANYATSANTYNAIETKTVTVEKQATAESGFASSYVVKQNGVQVGDTINIPKDQFLKNAIFCKTSADVPSGITIPEGQEFPALLFIFQTLTEDEHPVFVSVKDLITTYEAGSGILMSGNVISVKVAESGATKNFLDIENNALAVREIETDVTKTSSDIAIDGGAWATAVKEAYGNTLPAGTTLQDFFNKMLRKEYWNQSNTTLSTKFNVEMENINIPFSTSETVLEVGTDIFVDVISCPDTKQPEQGFTAKTFDYGYKIGSAGTYTNSKTYTKTLAPTLTSTFNNNTTANYFNFVNYYGNTIPTQTGTDFLEQLTIYVNSGTNTVNVYCSGDTYSSETYTPETLYIATSFQNYNKKGSSDLNTFAINPQFDASKRGVKTGSKTITGCYKIYTGYTTNVLDNEEFNLKYRAKSDLSELTGSLMTGTTKDIATMGSSAEKSCMAIVMPATWAITQSQSELGSSNLDNWVRYNTFNYVNGPITTSYKVWIFKSGGAINIKNIKIQKA